MSEKINYYHETDEEYGRRISAILCDEVAFEICHCEHEEHDTCWDIEPDIGCSCCVETMKQMLTEDEEEDQDGQD
tara:strand:- start:3248 stop:3472 length:225 start_codon:yes stop_codon:yes gene_type:complete